MKKLSKKHKQNISKSMKGHLVSEEIKKKISKNHNKKSNWIKGRKHTKETKRKMRKSHKGKVFSKEHKQNISNANKGRILSENWREKISISLMGNKNPSWKGGIIPKENLLRTCARYQIWRNLIFLRDNFTCQNSTCEFCNNDQGIYLQAHHIKSLNLYPELAFRVDNGITYCKEFHIKTGLHKNKLKRRILCTGF